MTRASFVQETHSSKEDNEYGKFSHFEITGGSQAWQQEGNVIESEALGGSQG